MEYAWEFEDPDHPRPAEVATVEAFLNTVDHHRFGEHAGKPDAQRDLFRDPQQVGAWFHSWGLLEEGAEVAFLQAQEAVVLRDGLRAWLLARQGLSHDERALEQCQQLIEELPLAVSLRPDSAALVPSADDFRGALACLVRDVAVAEVAGSLARLKICAAADCRFVFYDHSKSRTGRWCSMQICGNRAKKRRYRARQDPRM